MSTHHFPEKSRASFRNFLHAPVELSGIPRVGNHSVGLTGVLQKIMQLSIRITAKDPLHHTQIFFVHSNDQIVFGVVCFAELFCLVVSDRDMPVFERTLHRRIYRISNFFV